MKLLIFSFVAIVFVVVFVRSRFKQFGSMRLSQQNLDSLKVMGELHLEDVSANLVRLVGPLNFNNLHADVIKVLGQVFGKGGSAKDFVATGQVKLENFECDKFDVIGQAKLKNVRIKKIGSLVGELIISDSTFDTLEVWANNPKFKNCFFEKDLVVKNTNLSAIISLTGETVVQGDIILENPDSRVVRDRSVKILGDIIYKKGEDVSLLKMIWKSISSRIF